MAIDKEKSGLSWTAVSVPWINDWLSLKIEKYLKEGYILIQRNFFY
jgi:hypothetical protein